MNYNPTKADPDVWVRPAMRADGFQYYEMVLLVHVDNILCVSHDLKATMTGLQITFKLKDEFVAMRIAVDFIGGLRYKQFLLKVLLTFVVTMKQRQRMLPYPNQP